MSTKPRIMSKLTLGFIVTALSCPFSLFSHSAQSTESDSRMRIDNETTQGMYKEMQKIQKSLANRDIKSARESLLKMRELAGKSVMYDMVIKRAKDKIEETEGVGTKVRTPMGAQKSRPLPVTPDISDVDIAAFDDAFLTNNDSTEARRIFNKYPKTEKDSAKKTEFLNYASEALGIMNAKENVDPRTALYGTKVRTPMGAQKSPGPATGVDITDSDIEAFKNAYEKDDVGEATRIFNKYHRTAQDSQKKREFLDLAEMQMQVMG